MVTENYSLIACRKVHLLIQYYINLSVLRYTQEDEHTLTYYELFEDRKSFYEVRIKLYQYRKWLPLISSDYYLFSCFFMFACFGFADILLLLFLSRSSLE